MVTRRTILKASIFACLPCIPAMEIKPGIDMSLLKEFVDREPDGRFAMKDPFVEDGNASATDGRIGIRVYDAMGIADKSKELRLPPLSKAFSNLWYPCHAWKDFPSAEYFASDYGACWMCNGHGYLGELRECTYCYATGDGLDEFSECGHCWGGMVSNQLCPECNGKPYRSGVRSTQRIGEQIIAAGYHHRIAKLPGVRYCVSERRASGLKPILFTFEGGDGIVMPLEVR